MKTTDHLKWFTESRLGMFIHWGVYSQQHNGEWVMNADEISVQDYRALAEQFTAENLDVDAWVRTAKNAGMKYMVLTTKHHDGFCLWDTNTTDFNAVKTGPRRDVVREFVDACHRHDIRVGLYWSWVDWNYPEWAEKFVWSDLKLWRQPFDDIAAHNRMIDYLHAQVRELMTNYGKIDVFWFDGGFLTAEQYRSRELVDEMRRLQPDILINDRAGFPGDFGNPEGLMPTDGSDRAWELCHCSAAFTTWTAPIDDPALFASPSELLGLLSDAAGLGGNFLLNFGPQADGTLPKYSIEQLDVIGKWMQLNGDAIYHTQAGPTGRQEWGVSTQRGNTVYLHIFRPASQLAVRGFETLVKLAIILSTGEPVHFIQNGMSLIIDLPAIDILPQVVALEFDESPQFIPQAISQRMDKSIILAANHAKLKTIHTDNKPILFLSPDALGGRIMGWSRIDNGVEWTFKVEHAGRYQPSFEFNNPESLNVYGRRFEMSVSGQTLRASVPLSGRHGRFECYTMAGAFNLTPGVHTLTIKPYILDSGILMNLRAVTLKPLN
jgi:alpha-L-fucosidase